MSFTLSSNIILIDYIRSLVQLRNLHIASYIINHLNHFDFFVQSNNPGRGSSKSRGRGRRSSQTRNDRPPLKLEDDPQTRNDPPMLKVEDDPYGYNILRRPQQTPPTSVTQSNELMGDISFK